MKYVENQPAEHDEDDLPFALSQEEQLQPTQQYIAHKSIVSTSLPFQEARSALPQLASSSISSPTTHGESQLSLAQSGLDAPEFRSCADSRYLDAAASLLFPNSSSMNITTSSLPILLSHPSRNSLDFSSSATNDILDYSQLLKRANATSDKSPRSVVREHLSVLPEETPVKSSTLPSRPLIATRLPLSTISMMQSQATILDGMTSHTEQRLASLAGATARRTSTNSFEVTIEMSGGNSAMDILGNPSFLALWCDAIPSLVVTQWSEGPRGTTEQGREYDAEWMEGTTPYLIPPPNSSCMYCLLRTIQSSFGFPTFGRITMFVERQRCQVSLTIGTFDGGIDVSHTLRVEPLVGGKVRVTDEVRLLSEDTWSVFQSVFLPNVGDYMNQAVSSMARLRFLVERGGETCGYIPPSLGDMAPLL